MEHIANLPEELYEISYKSYCEGDGEYSIQIEIFSIEEVFDTLCNLLDEIVPRFINFINQKLRNGYFLTN